MGSVPVDVYASQGLTWSTGMLANILPGVTDVLPGVTTGGGSNSPPSYHQVTILGFPPPMGGGGNQTGIVCINCGIVTFSMLVNRVGFTAGEGVPKYITAWDQSGRCSAS